MPRGCVIDGQTGRSAAHGTQQQVRGKLSGGDALQHLVSKNEQTPRRSGQAKLDRSKRYGGDEDTRTLGNLIPQQAVGHLRTDTKKSGFSQSYFFRIPRSSGQSRNADLRKPFRSGEM